MSYAIIIIIKLSAHKMICARLAFLLALLTLSAISIAQKTDVPTEEEQIELKLVLEVTRHGQRAPEKIFNLTVNPEENF